MEVSASYASLLPAGKETRYLLEPWLAPKMVWIIWRKKIALTGIRTPYLPAPSLVINHKSAREEVELLGEASSHLMLVCH